LKKAGPSSIRSENPRDNVVIGAKKLTFD
jgi:hypothetical protein